MKMLYVGISVAVLAAVPARADKIVDLNSAQLQIDNTAGEKIVLRRTKDSPNDVKVNMNPEARHSSSCDHWSSTEHCSPSYCDTGSHGGGWSGGGHGGGWGGGGGGGWSGGGHSGGGGGHSGGSSGGGGGHSGGCHRVQGSNGVWHDECWSVLMPISEMNLSSCCTTSSSCDSYSDHVYNDYVDFELEFKDNLLQDGEVDEIQIVPGTDRKHAELKILTSKQPYKVKTAFFNKRHFTLKQQ